MNYGRYATLSAFFLYGLLGLRGRPVERDAGLMSTAAIALGPVTLSQAGADEPLISRVERFCAERGCSLGDVVLRCE